MVCLGNKQIIPLFLLWLHLFILSGVISPLFSSSTLGTYQPGELIFQHHVFLPFHTVHGVLKARILKWVASAFSSAVKDNISLIVNVSLSEQIGSFSPIKKINLKSFPFSFFMYCLCEKYCKPITIQFRCCKEKYCIGTWNARFMNQGKLEVVKQEMARVNVDILGISKLK